MNNALAFMKSKQIHLFSALVGVVLATVIFVSINSVRADDVELAQWQIAAIYVLSVVASILFGVIGREEV